jgi:DnaK suppressor protein
MDGELVEKIRNALLARRNSISGNADRDSAFYDYPDGIPQTEMVDIAQTLEQLDRDSSLAEQERRELVAIERALVKMATGSFGLCEECGEEIPSKRLMIVPEARLCTRCQTVEERLQARTRGLLGAGAR